MEVTLNQTIENIDISSAFCELTKMNIGALYNIYDGLYSIELKLFDTECNSKISVTPYREFAQMVVVQLYDDDGREIAHQYLMEFPPYIQKYLLKQFIKALDLENKVGVKWLN